MLLYHEKTKSNDANNLKSITNKQITKIKIKTKFLAKLISLVKKKRLEINTPWTLGHCKTYQYYVVPSWTRSSSLPENEPRKANHIKHTTNNLFYIQTSFGI